MAKETNTATKKHDMSISMPFVDMTRLNGGMFEPWAQTGQALMETAFALNQQMMRFAGERLQADMEAFQALSQCANWQDMTGFQADFARSAVEAYQAQFFKLMERSAEAGTATWKPVYDSAKPSSKGAAQE